MEEKITKTYNRKQKFVNPNFRKSIDPEVRKFEGELRPLMTEAEKEKAQVLELSYDFSCRIIRLYKYLNEGKLGKADRGVETLTLTLTLNTIGYATIKRLTNGSQLHHLRFEIQGLVVKD